MRNSCALGLLVVFSWIGGLAQDARAGVTVDVVFQDAWNPSGLTIMPGDSGYGCEFGGPRGGSTPSGYCMDVILTSTHPMVALSASVSYDSDDGLAVGAVYEHKGFPAGTSRCVAWGGVTDTGSRLESFDCILQPPHNPPTLASGTYRIGTIVWDTSRTTVGWATVSAVINDLFDGVFAVINGNLVPLDSSEIVVESHIFYFIPEASTALLLGLGLVALAAGRRRR